jgi:hypothetical protein
MADTRKIEEQPESEHAGQNQARLQSCEHRQFGRFEHLAFDSCTAKRKTDAYVASYIASFLSKHAQLDCRCLWSRPSPKRTEVRTSSPPSFQ